MAVSVTLRTRQFRPHLAINLQHVQVHPGTRLVVPRQEARDVFTLCFRPLVFIFLSNLPLGNAGHMSTAC